MVVKRIFIVVILVLLGSTTVYADTIPQPDDIEFFSARGYIDIPNIGDVLIISEYKISYTILPSLDINQAFLVRLMDGNLELSSVNPHVRDPLVTGTKGYERSLVGFFFDAEEAVSLGIVSSGVVEPGLSVSISGSPVVFTDPDSKSMDVSLVSPILGLSLLRIHTEAMATALASDWGLGTLDLVTSGFVFTSAGSDYFVSTIPRIVDIFPEIFPRTVTSIEYGAETYTQDYATNRDTFFQSSLQLLHQQIKDLLEVQIFVSLPFVLDSLHQF